MSIRDVLRFCYNTDTTELRLFGGFGWIRLGLYVYMVRFSYDIQKCMGKYDTKNTLKHLRIIYESGTDKGKFVAVLYNS